MKALLAVLLASTAIDEAARYPEGPLWRGRDLLVAELGADAVFRHHDGRKTPFVSAKGCGPTSIATYGEGYLVLCHLAGEVLAVSSDGEVRRRWSADAEGERLTNPNDSTADDQGGVYFSDPGRFSAKAPAEGALRYLDASGALHTLASGLFYPNGVYFDHSARALYVSEHLARKIWVYPVVAPGRLGPRRLFADIERLTPRRGAYPEAGPDGLEKAPDGSLVVALYGEGRLIRLSPQGALLEEIFTPFPFVTNLAFAPDGAMAVVGAHRNAEPPFWGAVLSFK